MEKKSIIVNGNKLEFLEFMKPSGKYPVIIFLHGLGQRGSLDAVASEGLPEFLLKGLDIPFHVLCPRSGSGWFDPKLYVQPLINAYKGKANVAEFCLTGLSSGGNGVYAYLTSQFDDVAAYAPIAINSSSFAAPLKNRPLWHFHGAKDGSPNQVITSEGFIKAYNKLNPGMAKRTVFTNLGHDSWTATYGSDFKQPTTEAPFDDSLYSWFESVMKSEPIPEPEPEPIPDVFIEKIKVQNGNAVGLGSDGKYYFWTLEN